MMKSIPFQLLIVAITSLMFTTGCQEDKAREEATAKAKQSATEQPPAPVPGQKPTMDSTPVGVLNLSASSKTASKGSEVCVAVTARNFNRIVSMQYTLKWDNKTLKFKELRGFNLPGLSKDNFGSQLAEKEGLLTHSWFDANLQGVNRPDGASLYEICFEAIGNAGSKSYVEFVNAPVIFEISNADSQFLELKGERGMVEVR